MTQGSYETIEDIILMGDTFGMLGEDKGNTPIRHGYLNILSLIDWATDVDSLIKGTILLTLGCKSGVQ